MKVRDLMARFSDSDPDFLVVIHASSHSLMIVNPRPGFCLREELEDHEKAYACLSRTRSSSGTCASSNKVPRCCQRRLPLALFVNRAQPVRDRLPATDRVTVPRSVADSEPNVLGRGFRWSCGTSRNCGPLGDQLRDQRN